MTNKEMRKRESRKSQDFKKAESATNETKLIGRKLENPKVRYLKLQPFHRERRIDFFTTETRKVPQLRLCGDWLEAAGFSPENYVSVTVMEGLLIIRSSKANSDDLRNL